MKCGSREACPEASFRAKCSISNGDRVAALCTPTFPGLREPYGAKRASEGHITSGKKCKRGGTQDNRLFPDPIHADRGGVRLLEGLHFYTLNKSSATRQIVANLELDESRQ